MKLILSRKGFDTAAGGGPSPILPDGTLLSLPIPADAAINYDDVRAPGGATLAEVLQRLHARVRPHREGCHLDPDLDPQARPRLPGWRPAFGTLGAAGTHLRRHGVGVGDLFLYFGWFRQTREDGGRLRWTGPDLHVVFGYLQVGERIDADPEAPLPAWLESHPHACPRLRRGPSNTIFVAAPELSLPGGDAERPGAGLLDLAPQRVLTAEGLSRSRWALPREVFGDRDITYHSPRSWRDGWFQSAMRGQEFVLEMNRAVAGWVDEIIES